MASRDDVREIEAEAKVRRKRRFDARDWDTIAEYVCDEYHRRKTGRGDLEKHWDDIDRQLAMEPKNTIKKDPRTGKNIAGREWMSEMELPLQAQTLEVLTADSRRMLFPDSGPWYRPHAQTTDEYLQRVEFASLITGDQLEVPSKINQDNADKLVEGFGNHLRRQYDFFGNYDHINAEAFKYGTGIGRARLVSKTVQMRTARGVMSETARIPMLLPQSIRCTYLDDRAQHVMNEGLVLGPGIIKCGSAGYEDIVLAAVRGSDDPDSMEGGWMPRGIKGLQPDDKGNVTLLEYEGDLVVPRKTTTSLVIRGAIVTVCLGTEGRKGVIRFRFRKTPYPSYVVHPYHVEDLASAYATSPLMKGRPIQIAATEALNRLMDSAMLKVAPPVGYERDDAVFAADGGPAIKPFAQWATTDEVKVYDKIGGDLAPMLQVYLGLLQQYANMTGVNAPRLGAQTVSHTTAFAKEAEINRGVVRTVDYVRATGHGPVTQWLYMEYDMGRRSMTGEQSFYVDAYGGFVTAGKTHLPEKCAFEWFGSGGPAEEEQKRQRRLQSLQLAFQVDQLNIQAGGRPVLIGSPLPVEAILRQGGWEDIDAITGGEGSAGATAEPSGVAESGDDAGAGATIAALQEIAGGQG